MKLSELTPEQKTRLLAELDGYKPTMYVADLPYLTSYDAIIPLVQKLYPQWNDRQKDNFMRQFMTADNYMMATPSQLCDAVLIATGKAEL